MDENQTTKEDVPEGQVLNEVKLLYAFVSKRALEADYIGFCYRDYPETAIDSGWRFLYGDEDEDYLDNPRNSESVYPEEMLSINPALESILSAPVNSEYEWNDEQQCYVEIV